MSKTQSYSFIRKNLLLHGEISINEISQDLKKAAGWFLLCATKEH